MDASRLGKKFFQDVRRKDMSKQRDARLEENAQNEMYKQEASVNVDNVFGTETLVGTGYSTFKELVEAKNKKIKELQSRQEEEKRYSGLSSLIGKNSTLG